MAWLLIGLAFVVALVLGVTATIAVLAALALVLLIVLIYGASVIWLLVAVVVALTAVESEHTGTVWLIVAGLAASLVMLRDANRSNLEPRQSAQIGAPPPRRARPQARATSPAPGGQDASAGSR
jgi:hypothetical protein